MNSDESPMLNYYKDRAPIYDRVYFKPERQQDLRFLEKWVPTLFRGKRVLEIACGTGYWTQFIAPVADRMSALDVTSEALEQARRRSGVDKVEFVAGDAFHLSEVLDGFDAAFAGLWLSHVPKELLRDFLTGLHARLAPGSPVLFLDNSDVQCLEFPISRTDASDNTYQRRRLDNGTEYEVLKNFPKASELETAIEGLGKSPVFCTMDNFWWFHYFVA